MHPFQPQTQNKSFAQALQNACDTPISNFVKPYLKGNCLSIKMPEEAYKVGLKRCRNNLYGRLITSKCNVPLKASKLRDKRMILCSPITNWNLHYYGKHF